MIKPRDRIMEAVDYLLSTMPGNAFCAVCGQDLEFSRIVDKENDVFVSVTPCAGCADDKFSEGFTAGEHSQKRNSF